jgi:hypothetical protein
MGSFKMKTKEIERQRRIPVLGKDNPEMEISKFRKYWIKKRYDLVDITKLCEFKLGDSGWCNDFNEPDERIYHLQVIYRNEWVGTFKPSIKQDNIEDKFVVFITDESFIIFMKVKIENDRN